MQLTPGGEGLKTHDGDLVIRPHKVLFGCVVEGQRHHTLLQIRLVNSKDWIIFK